ncbi:hypothetical protein [Aquibacillus salsiterrae]|uniref:PhoD-like phosphatase metallophosphatase domain-containing protein n=1 Tax=Aquibacillus salsiterrae TaxID=2950439 RepID=A0A9X3WCG8_9BACI|nr:hypothetical protein [Aquibacillus salsiterrae]MDC3416937.1 hypothetical protein [Aquibacillus salsiterrae]
MKLPEILSGPLVRRVEPSQINLWLATSKTFKLEAEILIVEEDEDTFQYTSFKTKTSVESVKLGANLYIHLLTIYPVDDKFPVNQLLAYNIFFIGQKKKSDLASFDLLSTSNPHAIVYPGLEYPTFFINDQEETELLYGSCRKPHSSGYDALAGADAALEEKYSNLQKRPSSLFLVGDQIYADDVAHPLSLFIYKLGRALMGKKEPLHHLDSRLMKEPFRTARKQINGRQFMMKSFAKFTSTNASNHLIEFGEYAAMYLLTFGPELWDLAEKHGVFRPFHEVIKSDNFYFYFTEEQEKEYEKEKNKQEAIYQEQLKNVYTFKQNLFRVRRLLANTPTYMIFDDHDITDDWNLTIDWKKDVRNSPLGRHVIANGLAAYWAFQGLGNEPEMFDSSFKQTITTHLTSLSVTNKSYERWIEMLWEFNDWQFVAPTSPIALFLDTRTMRAYDPEPKPTKVGAIIEENIRPPQLINAHGFKKAKQALIKSGWKKHSPLTIISATPLYGIELIETFLHNYIYPLRIVGLSVQTMLDFEAWKYNSKGVHAFHNFLFDIDPSVCYILSGDVHYASSVTSDITNQAGEQIKIYQFTSSPLHNESFHGIWGTLMKKITKLNAAKRKQTIHRYCDSNWKLKVTDSTNRCPEKFYWREEINYQIMNNGAMVKTDNNVGQLHLGDQSVQNALLTYYGVHHHVTYYPKLSLFNKKK